MTRIAVVLAAVILVLGLSLPVSAGDEPSVSFTFNMELITVSMPGINLSALHDKETERMIKRAAQLARYAACELVTNLDSPLPCSKLLE